MTFSIIETRTKTIRSDRLSGSVPSSLLAGAHHKGSIDASHPAAVGLKLNTSELLSDEFLSAESNKGVCL